MNADGDDLFRLAVAEDGPETLSPLERMTHLERLQADFTHLSLTTGSHPMKLMRGQLPDVVPAGELANVPDGKRIKIGGSK